MTASTFTDPACLFCRIIAGEIPSRQVYADHAAVAFLDVVPLKRGHTLVVPRAHVTDAIEAPEVLARIAPAIAAAGALLRARLGASGVNLLSNIGSDAGQSVFHLHVHLIPRYADDPGLAAMVERTTPDDLDAVAAVITGSARL